MGEESSKGGGVLKEGEKVPKEGRGGGKVLKEGEKGHFSRKGC